MIRQSLAWSRILFAGIALLGTCAGPPAEAGGALRRRARVVVPTVCAAAASESDGMLGTFYPSPYLMVRGNGPIGGGYSPLNQYGDTTMALYGPLSALRAASAPVLLYGRSYDGRPVLLEATSSSTPNLPPTTPVIYPTRATYYYGFRESGTPPWWDNAINWIDQN
jgi:hypothetical protein